MATCARPSSGPGSARRRTGGWELQPGAGILPLPEQKAALVPDFTLLQHETGEKAHLEILGFWSERTLVDRVALIRAAEKKGHRVLIAASENLGTSSETLSRAVEGTVSPFQKSPQSQRGAGSPRF